MSGGRVIRQREKWKSRQGRMIASLVKANKTAKASEVGGSAASGVRG
jgi:hypothetical protein